MNVKPTLTLLLQEEDNEIELSSDHLEDDEDDIATLRSIVAVEINFEILEDQCLFENTNELSLTTKNDL